MKAQFNLSSRPQRVRLRRRLGLVLWRTALRVSNAKLFLANCGAQITTLQTPQKLSASNAVTFIKRQNSWASTSAPKDVRKRRNYPSSSHWSAFSLPFPCTAYDGSQIRTLRL